MWLIMALLLLEKTGASHLAPRRSPLATRHSPLITDTSGPHPQSLSRGEGSMAHVADYGTPSA